MARQRRLGWQDTLPTISDKQIFEGDWSAASGEQAQGIEQVNTAVTQMDKVTQSNAANAEESASASEELSAQSRELNDMVATLVQIVGGAGNGQNGTVEKPALAAPAPDRRTTQASPQMQLAQATSHEVKPEQVIPLDDNDMEDF